MRNVNFVIILTKKFDNKIKLTNSFWLVPLLKFLETIGYIRKRI